MRSILTHLMCVVMVLAASGLRAGPVVPKKQEDRRNWKEADWVKLIASQFPASKRAIVEYRLPCRSRVDILTAGVAYEVDYAEKWAEGIGQALYYAAATNRRPGVILLIRENDADRRHYLRALAVCARYGITLKTIKIPERPPPPKRQQGTVRQVLN